MPLPRLSEIRETLFTAVLSDCLDQIGVRNQALPARIRPLDDASVMVGRARTAVFMEVWHVEDGVNPYELEIALIDSLRDGEIPVFACSNPERIAPWGELLSTAAQVRGSAGALMDGCVRDIKAIRAMGFPCSTRAWRPSTAGDAGA
jgi:regulator of RNase E activity RraA